MFQEKILLNTAGTGEGGGLKRSDVEIYLTISLQWKSLSILLYEITENDRFLTSEKRFCRTLQFEGSKHIQYSFNPS